MNEGRYFIHEHPTRATSWAEPCLERFVNAFGVNLAHADTCHYGMNKKAIGNVQLLPIQKYTGWMSNMKEATTIMRSRCGGRS